eukprot:7081172-Ditylum_brightwellii.AAC.2
MPSNRLLETLAVLSEQHCFVIAADEVLNVGRCAKILQTLYTLSCFAKRVNYIYLGRWMGMGMVLTRAEMLNNDIVRQTGETTGTNYYEAISAFKQVIPHLNKITEKRKKILNLLKTDESKA